MTDLPVNSKPPKPFINSRSAHNVNLWIRNAIAEGRLKKCWHLDIDKIEIKRGNGNESVDAGESYFVPSCAHQSFESTFGHVDDDTQLHVLRYSLSTDPIWCPANCTYYRNQTWGRVRFETGRIFETARNLVKGFVGLSWQTQVAMIILIVLVIAPKWVPLLVSLVRVIWGKTP